MKVLSLNTWCGQIFTPLLQFISEKATEIDVFCFQEVMSTDTEVKESHACRMNLFEELQQVLPNHQGYFAVAQDGVDIEGPVDFQTSFGLAMFIRKDLKVNKAGDVFVFRHKNACQFNNADQHAAVTMGRNMQYAEIETAQGLYTICNLHGLWNGQGKSDSPNRIQQSYQITSFLKQVSGKKILGGDFNLLPNTESLQIIKTGLIDLITQYNIQSTRSHYYRHYGENDSNFADYMLVSPDITVQDFKVLSDAVSDHLPLYLDCI